MKKMLQTGCRFFYIWDFFYTQFMAFFVELCAVLGIYEQINRDKKNPKNTR